MNYEIDLCGKWLLETLDKYGESLSLEASVPGCLHTDLIANGIIKNIFYRDNSRDIQWVENRDATYSRAFFVESLYSNAYLEAEGLDTYCDIYLNGVIVGSADNMFVSHSLCVDGILRKGENRIEIRFRSPIKEVEGLPLRAGAFTRERMNTRRIQCTYGWDWVDRFVTVGIYRPLRIRFHRKNEIDNVYVFTKDINSYSAQLKLEIAIRDFCKCGDTVRMELIEPDGRTVFSKERVLLKDSLYEYIDVPDPRLWYPAGYGEQPLYTLRVSTPTSSVEQKVGIRRITVLQLEDEEGTWERETALWLQGLDYLQGRDLNEKTACFAVLVNGMRIMCKGGNWVPCEPFPSSESPDKIRRTLELAVEMGANTVRVWGGGIFERDEFYDTCDRLGILVTQDFLMACGSYPEDEQWFIDALQREARGAVLRLRNHPCLIFWSGDNENAEWGDENSDGFNGYRSAAYGIEPVVSALDKERYFFPSSPYGGNKYSSATRGTTHNTNFVWYQLQYIKNNDLTDYRRFFSEFVSRFCAEQAAFGMSFPSSLLKYLEREDIEGEDDTMLEYHTKSNPAFTDISLYGYISMMAEKIFGKYESGSDRVLKQGMLHCEWVRITFELYRRYKGFANGIVYWMLNDCWPAASGWSFIDYYACPKPAYYTFKRCAKPVVATVSECDGRLELYISNDSLEAVSGGASLYFYNTVNDEETPIAELDFVDIAPDRAQRIYSCNVGDIADGVIVLCDITSSAGSDRAMLIPKRYCDLGIEYIVPTVLDESEDTITVKADRFIPYAMLDLPYLLSDNCFTMKKGETVTLKKLKRL